MGALYNDIEPYAADILRLRIADGLIPSGFVSTTDIRKLCKRFLGHFNHVHLFAGIGGFGLGARLAGVPDALKLFTAGFPCQPFSNAGRRAGANDNRYLWPQTLAAFQRHKPDVAIFENVAGLASMAFPGSRTLVGYQRDLDGQAIYTYQIEEFGVLAHIRDQIEATGYDVAAFIIPAVGVDAKHKRDRIWLVALPRHWSRRHQRAFERRQNASRQGKIQQPRRTKAIGAGSYATAGRAGYVANTARGRRGRLGHSAGPQRPDSRQKPQPIGRSADVPNATGWRRKGSRPFGQQLHSAAHPKRKANQPINVSERCFWPTEPAVCRVVNGLPGRMDRIKALGNAIVPQVAAEILSLILEALGIQPVFHFGEAAE